MRPGAPGKRRGRGIVDAYWGVTGCRVAGPPWRILEDPAGYRLTPSVRSETGDAWPAPRRAGHGESAPSPVAEEATPTLGISSEVGIVNGQTGSEDLCRRGNGRLAS